MNNIQADGREATEQPVGLTREQKLDYVQNHNIQRDIALTGGYDPSGMPAGGWKPERGFYLPKPR